MCRREICIAPVDSWIGHIGVVLHSLWNSDAKWRHESLSILARVMVCCHNRKQCLLFPQVHPHKRNSVKLCSNLQMNPFPQDLIMLFTEWWPFCPGLLVFHISLWSGNLGFGIFNHDYECTSQLRRHLSITAQSCFVPDDIANSIEFVPWT